MNYLVIIESFDHLNLMYQPQLQRRDVAYSAYSGHYPNQYASTSTVPVSTPYFPTFPHLQQQLPQKPPDVRPPPPEPSVTPAVASRAIQRLVSSELRFAGLDSAHQSVVQRLELEVVALVQRLFQRAHEYANLANRSGAIASDLALACEEFNLPITELRKVRTRAKSKKSKKMKGAAKNLNLTPSLPILVPPRSRSPSPELLGSDDEGTTAIIPATLRNLPPCFPSLPPKHTYLQTPASPPKKAALPSLEKKLKTASLVQDSLQNLLLATEDNTNQEDGELLGHIVNWEMGVHPRKRWKIGPK